MVIKTLIEHMNKAHEFLIMFDDAVTDLQGTGDWDEVVQNLQEHFSDCESTSRAVKMVLTNCDAYAECLTDEQRQTNPRVLTKLEGLKQSLSNIEKAYEAIIASIINPTEENAVESEVRMRPR